MSGQTWWVVAIVAVVVAGVIGFFVGRQSGGAKQRIEELEGELQRQKDEVAGYKREVESHFDKTATLFVSMAGSYKELFEHLSSGYERLSAGGARDVFKERVTALLLDGTARKNGGEGVVLEHSDEKVSGTAPGKADDAQAEREPAVATSPEPSEPSAEERSHEGQAGPEGAKAGKSAEGEASPERGVATGASEVPDQAEQEAPAAQEPTQRKEPSEQGVPEQETTAGQEPADDRVSSGVQEPETPADEDARRAAGAEGGPTQATDTKA